MLLLVSLHFGSIFVFVVYGVINRRVLCSIRNKVILVCLYYAVLDRCIESELCKNEKVRDIMKLDENPTV